MPILSVIDDSGFSGPPKPVLAIAVIGSIMLGAVLLATTLNRLNEKTYEGRAR